MSLNQMRGSVSENESGFHAVAVVHKYLNCNMFLKILLTKFFFIVFLCSPQ